MRHLVIGSGPAGVAVASALLDAGQEVLILDGGEVLEPAREALRVGMAGRPAADWNAAERALLAPLAAGDVPDKMSFGSDYPYRRPPQAARLEPARPALQGSFAQGGLSNVWGSALLPYRQADLAGWPLDAAALAPSYAAVLRDLPLAAAEDALAPDWPLFKSDFSSLARSRQGENFSSDLRASGEKLAAAGLRCGAARLAVTASDCIYCGRCLQGCPRELIFSTRARLAALRARGAEIIHGMVVRRIEEGGAGARIFAVARQGGDQEFSADRVFLAAGVLNSAEILIRSLGLRRLELLDSQYFILPLLRWRRTRNVRTENLHTLAQMFLELEDQEISPFTVHLQLYGYNDILRRMLERKLGRLADLVPQDWLLDRMMILQGYLHSAHSGRIELALGDDDVLRVTPHPRADTGAKIKSVARKLRRLAPALRAVPLAPLLQITAPGRGFHAGGSFPMARRPVAGQSDLLGRPHGLKRVHLVDASVFPSVPATTITLTVMANAYRIGAAVARGEEQAGEGAKMPVVAVTGANGYVGGVICAALAPGAEILRLVRRPVGTTECFWSFESESESLTEILRRHRVTHLVHAAWDMQASRLEELEAGCVAGSRRLVEAAAAAGTRIVFISTISAFAGARSAYGRAKLQVERMVLAAGGVVLRPGLVYGEGEGGMFGNLRRTVRGKFLPMIGDGSAPQFLLHEATLGEAARLAVAGGLDAAQGPVTLADPTPIAFRDLLRHLAAAQGGKPILLPVPWQVFYAGLRGAERLGLKLGFRSDSVVSFIFQDQNPDFTPMRRAGIVPRELAG